MGTLKQLLEDLNISTGCWGQTAQYREKSIKEQPNTKKIQYYIVYEAERKPKTKSRVEGPLPEFLASNIHQRKNYQRK